MDQALEDLREEFESIDGGLLRMWEKRMYAALKAGVMQREVGVRVFDPEQEKQLWYTWQQQLDEDNADLAALLFQANAATARLRQSRICRSFKPNIYLIGLSISGKDAVGRRVAQTLGRGFCSTDELIKAMFDNSFRALERQDEEDLYAPRETAVLSALAAEPGGMIVAVGDEAVLSPVNVSLMRASGAMILLRRENDEGDELWRQRKSLYQSAAAATVMADDAEAATSEIVEMLS